MTFMIRKLWHGPLHLVLHTTILISHETGGPNKNPWVRVALLDTRKYHELMGLLKYDQVEPTTFVMKCIHLKV